MTQRQSRDARAQAELPGLEASLSEVEGLRDRLLGD